METLNWMTFNQLAKGEPVDSYFAKVLNLLYQICTFHFWCSSTFRLKITTLREKPGHTFTLTADFDCLDATSYDALVIPGGRSPEYLATNKDVIAIVKEFMESRKPVASICHGQQILAAAGVLEGRKCTAYPAVKLNVVLAGATWREPSPITRCFTDGNLVTGAAWPGHPEFISQLMALLGIQVSFS